MRHAVFLLTLAMLLTLAFAERVLPTPTPTPTPYCAFEYCSDGVFHSGCYYSADMRGCACRENTPCDARRCNEAGTACYSPPRPTPTPTPTHTPTPTATPAPSPTPECASYCSGGVLFGGGYYSADQGRCIYETRYGCPYGCDREGTGCAEARPTPTPTPAPSPLRPGIGHPYPVEFGPYLPFLLDCSDFCANGTRYYNGTANFTRGGCSYKQMKCVTGCASNNRTCANLLQIIPIEMPQFFYFPCAEWQHCLDKCVDPQAGSAAVPQESESVSAIPHSEVYKGLCYANGSCGYSGIPEPCFPGCKNATTCKNPCENCSTGCFGKVARNATCTQVGPFTSCDMYWEQTCTATPCNPIHYQCARYVGNVNFVDADGQLKPLKNALVKVTYFPITGYIGINLPDRHTGSNGQIDLSDVDLYARPAPDVRITVYLHDWGNRFEVRNGVNISATDNPTTIPTKQTTLISKTVWLYGANPDTYYMNFTFANGDERPLARVYYHMEEAADFAVNSLNMPIDYVPPEEVYGYSSLCGGACHWSSNFPNDVWDVGIHLSPAKTSSVDGQGNSPTNCEWHEFGHHIMTDRFGYMPPRAGCNHCGYANGNSTDSWTEGFAEFTSMMMLDYYSYPNANLYWVYGGTINMEDNAQMKTDEEIGIASLLYDLMDPVSGEDCVDLTRGEIWNVIGSQHTFPAPVAGTRYIHGTYDLYLAFKAASYSSLHGDCDNDGVDNLDEIFIAHGAYYDSDNPPNGKWDKGEPIGYTKKNGAVRYNSVPGELPYLDRSSKNGSYIQINATDSHGNPVSECNATIRITYPDGCGLGENCDYDYNTSAAGCMLYYELPRDHETNASILVSAGNETATAPVNVLGSDFNRSYDPAKPYAMSFSVVLQPPTTPTPAPTATPTPAPTPAPTPTPPACPLGLALLLFGGAALLVAHKYI